MSVTQGLNTLSFKFTTKGFFKMVNILIEDGFVLTMKGRGVGLIENAAVAIEGNRIVWVGKTSEAKKKFKSVEKRISAKGKAVLPGLIDAHMHTSASLWRGTKQDISDVEWWGGGRGLVSSMAKDYTVKACELAVVEGLKSGTTTFGDFSSHVLETAGKVYSGVGVRANLAYTVNELEPYPHRNGMREAEGKSLYRFNKAIGEEKLKANLRLIDEWHGKANGRITCLLGPQAADMMGKELLLHIKEIAESRGLLIHFHLAQGWREEKQMKKRYGVSTVDFLEKIGFLGPNLVGVHWHSTTDEEVRLLARRGVRMISCPTSNVMIDGLVGPLSSYLDSGGYAAALGTDAATSNNTHNLMTEMKAAALLNKAKQRNPVVLPAWIVLRLATIEGARCLGLDKDIGSIEIGKKADLIIVNLKVPHLSPILSVPVRNIVPNLVYCARGDEIDTVIVDGKILMEERKLLTIDEEKVMNEAQEAAQRMAEQPEVEHAFNGLSLFNAMKEGLL